MGKGGKKKMSQMTNIKYNHNQVPAMVAPTKTQ